MNPRHKNEIEENELCVKIELVEILYHKIFEEIRKRHSKNMKLMTKVLGEKYRTLYGDSFVKYQKKQELFREHHNDYIDINCQHFYIDIRETRSLEIEVDYKSDDDDDDDEIVAKVERVQVFINNVRTSIERRFPILKNTFNRDTYSEQYFNPTYSLSFEYEYVNKKDVISEFKKKLKTNDILGYYIKNVHDFLSEPTVYDMTRRFLINKPRCKKKKLNGKDVVGTEVPMWISPKLDGTRYDGFINNDYIFVNNITIKINKFFTQMFNCHFEYIHDSQKFMLIDVYNCTERNKIIKKFDHLESIELMRGLFSGIMSNGEYSCGVNAYEKSKKKLKEFIENYNLKTDGYLYFYKNGIFKQKPSETIDLIFYFPKPKKEIIYEFFFRDNIPFSSTGWTVDLGSFSLENVPKNFQFLIIEFTIVKNEKKIVFYKIREKHKANSIENFKNMI